MSDKARELLEDSIREMYPDDSGRRHVLKNLDEGTLDLVSARAAIRAINAALREVPEARPLEEWHEDRGAVMWWTWHDGEWLGEAAWAGTPLDSDWPGYHTHWTQHPPFPPP